MAWNIANILIEAQKKSGGGGGTSDYSELSNKPQINSVTLSGNKSLSDLGIASASDVTAIQGVIPEDAATTNKLVTADDLPGLATNSVPGLVQPDGTTVTIEDGVISAVGGGGGSTIGVINSSPIPLDNLTWSQGVSGAYYALIDSITIPAGKTVISVMLISWDSIRDTDNITIYYSSGSNKVAILSNTNSFAVSASVTIRVAYI